MPSFGSLNRVNTNVQSMEARFALNTINRDLAQNQIKLATGLRINSAEDDAAGFSIASKLSSRIEGLDQALRNVGDAKSVLDIGESSINNIMDILVEMKGKAVQAANETLGDTERGFIEDQIEALGMQINEIASQTVFQDTDLLLGTTGTPGTGTLTMTFQVGERSSDTVDIALGAITTETLFTAGGTIGAAAYSTSGVATDSLDLGAAGTATADEFRSFIDSIDTAITTLSSEINNIGIIQNSLSIREETLSQQIISNTSARGSIMDTDFAKAQSESIRLQILQQTATAALSQANMGPQAVLSFIG